MKREEIIKIWIDSFNRLCVKSKSLTFDMIYRSAKGVNWNSDEGYLFTQKMVELKPPLWFRQIIHALEDEYRCQLYITEKTYWENIDTSYKDAIIMENYR
ncbi:MAG: hypothetical protein AAGU14_06680 [Eubacteriaceae bacterium]